MTKELTEKTEVLQQEEQRRKSLDGKVSAYEKQVSQLQVKKIYNFLFIYIQYILLYCKTELHSIQIAFFSEPQSQSLERFKGDLFPLFIIAYINFVCRLVSVVYQSCGMVMGSAMFSSTTLFTFILDFSVLFIF